MEKNIWYHVTYFDSFTNKNYTCSMSSKESIDKHFGTRYRKSRYKVLKVKKYG